MKRIHILVLSTLFSLPALAQQLPLATSLNIKMAEFTVPAGHECPIFSNSADTEMLAALDAMQQNINRIFPLCENRVNNDLAIKTSTELKNKIAEAQKLEKTGQTAKLTLTAESIVALTESLQTAFVGIYKVKTTACYNDEAEFRSTVFSINDTFQSIAPLIVDLAAKNRGLSKTLAPAVTIFTGVNAISKGLAVFEQIAKDSVQFPMKKPEDRVNTLKNICQFMKLYNRLELLRESKKTSIDHALRKFRSETLEKNLKVEQLKRQQIAEARAGAKGAALNESADINTIALYEKISTSLPTEQQALQTILALVNNANTDGKSANVTQCQAVYSTLRLPSLIKFRADFEAFLNSALRDPAFRGLSVIRDSNIEILLASLKIIEGDLQRYDPKNKADRIDCASEGLTWLNKVDEFFVVASGILGNYENLLVEQQGVQYTFQKKLLAQKMNEAKNAEADEKGVLAMLTNASFISSSEVEKRAKGMHKYLFAGPDQVKSECEMRMSDETPCTATEKALALLKTKYQKKINQGPAYELLWNNERYFNDSYKKIIESMQIVRDFENRFLLDQSKKPDFYPTGTKDYLPRLQTFLTASQKNNFDMPHITSQYLVKGTRGYEEICDAGNVAAKEYLVASQHIMSSVAICEMIEPVLIESEVSRDLKDYCRQATDTEASMINQLRYKLVGQIETSNNPSAATFTYSPKSFVETITEKIEALGCNKK